MNYNQARINRQTRLSDLIANRISTRDSIVGGVGAAMSDRFRANMVGIKERVDPLNLVKKATGSNLAATLFGRLTGRSAQDIGYFTNRAVPVSNNNKMASLIPNEMPNESVNLAPELQSIYNLLAETFDYERKRYDDERAFEEERKNEEERRHQKFLEVLKEYTGTKLLPVVEQPKEEEGLLSKLASMLKGISDFLYGGLKVFLLKAMKPLLAWFGKKLLSFVGKGLGFLFDSIKSGLKWLAGINWSALIGKTASLLMRVLRFFSFNPLGLVLLGATGVAALVKAIGEASLVDETGKPTPIAKTLDKVQRAVGGEGILPGREKSVEEKVKSAATKEGWLKRIGLGTQITEDEAQALKKVYNIDWPKNLIVQEKKDVGGQLSLPEGVTPSTAGAGRGFAITNMETPVSPVGETSVTNESISPVTQMPNLKFDGLSELMNENNDLRMMDDFDMGEQTTSQPTVSVNSNSQSFEGPPSQISASVRDTTPILLRVIPDMY